MKIWLGSFEWQQVGGLQGWSAPIGAQAVLDLRALADQGRSGGVAPRAAILFSDDAVSLPNATQLASDPDEVLTAVRRDRVRQAVQGLRPFTATRLSDVLWECLTELADPDAIRCCPPLMPAGLNFELFIGQWHRREAVDCNAPAWRSAQAMYQRLYRQVRAETLAGLHRPTFHRELLTTFCERRGLDLGQYERFVPPDLPRETPLPHASALRLST